MLSLIQAATADPEEQAFLLALYEDYDRLMYAIVKKYLPDPYAQEDVVQETMLRLVSKAALLRTLDPEALTAYVSVAVRNTACSYLRRQAQEASVLLPWDTEVEGIPQTMPSMDQRLIFAEESRDFLQVWKDLPPEDRFLLEGKYLLRHSDQDLAETLGCKRDSIRMRLTRLRRKVLKLLQEKEVGGP